MFINPFVHAIKIKLSHLHIIKYTMNWIRKGQYQTGYSEIANYVIFNKEKRRLLIFFFFGYA